mgnify:FL=1
MDYILKVLNGEMTIEEYPIRKDEVMNVVSMIEAFYKSARWGGRLPSRSWAGNPKQLEEIIIEYGAAAELTAAS